jgi:hypothetical protein
VLKPSSANICESLNFDFLIALPQKVAEVSIFTLSPKEGDFTVWADNKSSAKRDLSGASVTTN